MSKMSLLLLWMSSHIQKIYYSSVRFYQSLLAQACLTRPTWIAWIKCLYQMIVFLTTSKNLLQLQLILAINQAYNFALLWAYSSMSGHTHLKWMIKSVAFVDVEPTKISALNLNSFIIRHLRHCALKNPVLRLVQKFLRHIAKRISPDTWFSLEYQELLKI